MGVKSNRLVAVKPISRSKVHCWFATSLRLDCDWYCFGHQYWYYYDTHDPIGQRIAREEIRESQSR